jgi:hypothetical protein
MNVLFEREVKKLCKDLEWEEVVLVLLGVLDGVNGENEVYDDFKMSIEAYKYDKKKKEQNVGMCQHNVGEMSEKQTNGDLISRQSVITMLNKIENAVEDGEGYQFNEWVGYVKELPTEEVQPIVHGKWYDKKMTIKGAHGLAYGRWGCSVCKRKFPQKSNYCPNCGADMRGEE